MKKRLLILLALATLGTKTTYTFENFKALFNLSTVPGLNGFNSSIFQKFSTLNSSNLIDFSLLAGATFSASTVKNMVTAKPVLGVATLAASTYLFNRFNNTTKINQAPLRLHTTIPLLFAGICGIEIGLTLLQLKPKPSTSLLIGGATAYLSGALASGYACSEFLRDVSRSKEFDSLLRKTIDKGNAIKDGYQELSEDAPPYKTIMNDPEIPLLTKYQLMVAESNKCQELADNLIKINQCFDQLEDLGMSVKRYN